MFNLQNLKKARDYYNSLIKYPDRYYEEVCEFIAMYYVFSKPNGEDIKRFIFFIDKIRIKPSPYSSLYVLQCFLFDELKYSYKS